MCTFFLKIIYSFHNSGNEANIIHHAELIFPVVGKGREKRLTKACVKVKDGALWMLSSIEIKKLIMVTEAKLLIQ